jgi:hypothetical protein
MYVNTGIILIDSLVLGDRDTRRQRHSSGEGELDMGDNGEGGRCTQQTTEWWLLLTVETALNGDSKSTNERSPSFVGFSDLSCRYKRFLFWHWWRSV